MPRSTYTFASEWTVSAPPSEVYDLLVDVAGYPSWWPQVRAVVRLDEDVALVACRSLLPYTLHLEMRPVVRDRDTGELDAVLDGDLVGRVRWLLHPEGTGTRMRFDQEVTVPSRLLGLAGAVARPLLVGNHAWMMRGGRRGLRARVGRTAR